MCRRVQSQGENSSNPSGTPTPETQAQLTPGIYRQQVSANAASWPQGPRRMKRIACLLPLHSRR